MAALNFFLPGAPNDQLVGNLQTAKSAILVGVLNGVASPSYLQLCLGAGAGERGYYCLYLFASYLTAMLGVALLAVGMAFSVTTVMSSPAWETVVKCMAWIAKVLAGGTLQFGATVLHSCIGMLGSLMLLLGIAALA